MVADVAAARALVDAGRRGGGAARPAARGRSCSRAARRRAASPPAVAPGVARAGRDAALHAAAPPAARRRRRPARADQRQRLRRADRLPRRRRAASGWRRSPTRSSSTTGRSTCAPTTPSCASSRAPGAAAALARLRARAAAAAGRRAPRRCSPAGAELKSTFCVAKGATRLGRPPHRRPGRTRETLRVLPRGHRRTSSGCSRSRPQVVAHDLHPDYLSTTLRAGARGRRARSASSTTTPTSPRAWPSTAMTGPAVGAIFDGTGYGTDGTVWGGELLRRRPRGLRARRAPAGRCRCRAATRRSASRGGWRARGSSRRRGAARAPARAARRGRRGRWRRGRALARTRARAPLTTSMGRLFDAVAALCGVRARVTYEGQAAIELEAAGRPARARRATRAAGSRRRPCSTRAD